MQLSAFLYLLAARLYRLFILWMALSLILFAPAFCEVHGLLYQFGDAAGNARSGTAMPSMDMPGIDGMADMPAAVDPAAFDSGVRRSDSPAAPVSTSGSSLYGHLPSSTATMILSMFTLARPIAPVPESIDGRGSRIQSLVTFPEQLIFTPPHPPPILL